MTKFTYATPCIPYVPAAVKEAVLGLLEILGLSRRSIGHLSAIQTQKFVKVAKNNPMPMPETAQLTRCLRHPQAHHSFNQCQKQHKKGKKHPETCKKG